MSEAQTKLAALLKKMRAAYPRTAAEAEAVFLDLMEEHKAALVAARERAEADNAALLEAYRRTWGCVMHDNVLHSPACNANDSEYGTCTPECPALYVSNLLKADHPGAALLERLRALEEVARLLLRSGVNSRWVEGERRIDLCTMAADALKGAP